MAEELLNTEQAAELLNIISREGNMMVLPGKVVSLLEILQAYAESYAKLAHSVAASICRLGYTPGLDEHRKKQLIDALEEWLPHCERAELTLTMVHLLRVRKDIDAGVPKDELYHKLIELESRIEDELKTKLFFQLPLAKREYFESPNPNEGITANNVASSIDMRKGWEEIIDKFPDSVMDVEEMRKCFALSRYAASVFHSVNAIEVALIELGKFLDVVDPKSGWTAVTNRLEALVLKTKFPDLEPKFQQCFAFLEQVHATTVALKSAWRNKISHTHGKLVLMTSDFHPDVAEEIIVASRSFMRRLAEEMPT